jgi:ABC-2 type transport system permease protein
MSRARNPILAREISHRMRDNRTYFVPVVYLVILAVVALGIYALSAATQIGAAVQGFRIGEAIFHAVSFVQLGLVLLLVPSVSASAITSERDRKTLAPLLVTPLPRSAIALGKLVAPLLYILLLVSTSLPFAALAFGFGGADAADLARTYGCIGAAALFAASLGLFVSTIMKRTVPAVLLAYGLIALVVIGSLVGDLVLNVVVFDGGPGRVVLSYLNPFLPLVAAMIDEPGLRSEMPHLWITPALEIGLSAILFLASLARLRKMRE